MSKCKRCEDAEQATHDESNWLSACEAEKSGLSQAYRDILGENRVIYDDWWTERKDRLRLGRKIAKLKKRLTKAFPPKGF